MTKAVKITTTPHEVPAPKEDVVETGTEESPEIDAFSKRELITQATARSGMKRRDVKPVVEAVLAALGDAISEGRDMNLQPFGKLRISRQKELDKAHLTTMRLRRPKKPSKDAETLQ